MGSIITIYLDSRKAAQAIGAKWYFTNRLCKHGHLALRYASGICLECSRQRWRHREYDLYRFFKFGGPIGTEKRMQAKERVRLARKRGLPPDDRDLTEIEAI